VSNGLLILGTMTGTSCDGLDASCMKFNRKGWEIAWETSRPYPNHLRKRVLEIQKPDSTASLRQILELDADLGDWYGKELKALIKSAPKKLRPDAIANHGQTVGHYPALSRGAKKGMSFQVGDPTRIAFHTGITTIAGFRKGDMAAGGQGAPLVPLYHSLLAERLAGPKASIAIHNIGGMSNLTYIPGSNSSKLLAFDTGPGNIWIDAAAEHATNGKQKMDVDGKLALQGKADWKAIDKILKNRFFRLNPPKSTGRDEFPFELLLQTTRARGCSLVATATALTIESIAQAYERWIYKLSPKLKTIYFCGGGANNLALMAGLHERMAGDTEITTLASEGLDPRFIEAQAFSFFGFLSLLGKPIGGTWTGAKGFGPPAHIVPAENWLKLQAKLSRFNQR
jgi:anhydro-N-acetylmuramic acid kinase